MFQAKTKVSQTYLGFVKICKLVAKVVKKPKKWQDIQKSKNTKNYKIIQNWQSIQF